MRKTKDIFDEIKTAKKDRALKKALNLLALREGEDPVDVGLEIEPGVKKIEPSFEVNEVNPFDSMRVNRLLNCGLSVITLPELIKEDEEALSNINSLN
ncbi:hypothetical protein J4403_00890 [Candidatus Woesearchaeota archaeon]|nr:hypothetical protein [Candidatus Woesearchaeota archaeon]